MDALLQDLRYGIRMLVKSPGFTFVIVLTLAIGIAATTAMFGVLDQALIQPLPYSNPERIVHLDWGGDRGMYYEDLNGPMAKFFAENSRSFEATATAFYSPGCNLTGGAKPVHVSEESVSTGFFRSFGTQPFLGRDFLASDAEPGNVAILSYSLWKRHFGSDPKILGGTIQCNGRAYTVIGVLPQKFTVPEMPGDVWVPDTINHYLKDTGSNYWMVARLKEGVSFPQAQQEMKALSEEYRQHNPPPNWFEVKDGRIELVPLQEWRMGDRRKPLLLMFGAVTLVLLIACANIASLMLARSSRRRREIAVRLAIGAGRNRIFGQLITESLLLGMLGGVAGLLLTWWALQPLGAVLKSRFFDIGELTINFPVLGFVVLVSLLTGILAGITPALQMSNPNLSDCLKQGGRISADSGQQKARKTLVAVEVALVIVLLASSALLIRSFLLLRAVSPGFDFENVQAAEFSLGSEKYKSNATVTRFVDDVLTRVRTLPGLGAAAVSLSVPYRRGLNTAPIVSAECNSRAIEYRPITAGYFSLLHIPVLQGREFVEQERAPVAIVNDAFLRQCRPDKIEVGSQLTEHVEKFPRQVVGVVGDTKTYGLARRAPAMVYVPVSQVPDKINSYINNIFYWAILVRARQQEDLNTALEHAIQSVDPEQPVVKIHSLSQSLHDSIASSRLTVLIVGAFATMALLLTALGIYGLLSYFVTQRTQEIGIRLALGATQHHVLRLVISEGMLLVGIGTIAGIAGAFAATRLMSSLVFGVRPTDPITFVAALLFLLCVALLASYLPARRASRIDPVVALRYE